jgi:hypothetical protein
MVGESNRAGFVTSLTVRTVQQEEPDNLYRLVGFRDGEFDVLMGGCPSFVRLLTLIIAHNQHDCLRKKWHLPSQVTSIKHHHHPQHETTAPTTYSC